MPSTPLLVSAARRPGSGRRRAYELLRSMIRSRFLTRQDLLVEDELVKSLGVPRAAVRQALADLATEGLVSRQRHTGTRVSREYFQLPVDDVLPWAPPPGFMYRKIDDRHVPTMPFVADRMELDAPLVGVLEQVFEQVTGEGSEPLGVRTAYYRTEYTQPESWPSCPSLAFAFQYVFGAPLGDIETVVDATVADDETAALLHIAPGAPLLVREQTLRDVNGLVQEYSFSHYRADRVSFPIKTSSAGGERSARDLRPAPTPDLLPHRARSVAS